MPESPLPLERQYPPANRALGFLRLILWLAPGAFMLTLAKCLPVIAHYLGLGQIPLALFVFLVLFFVLAAGVMDVLLDPQAKRKAGGVPTTKEWVGGVFVYLVGQSVIAPGVFVLMAIFGVLPFYSL